MHALIAQERKAFHKQLLDTETLTLTVDGVVSNADKSSKLSKQIAQEIMRLIGQNDGLDIKPTKKIAGQTLGKQFEFSVTEFLQFGSDDSVELLKALISGRRLKDISDLPLDLAV